MIVGPMYVYRHGSFGNKPRAVLETSPIGTFATSAAERLKITWVTATAPSEYEYAPDED